MELQTDDSPVTHSSTLTHASQLSLPLPEDVDVNTYIDPQELEHDLEDDPQELILTADEIDALSQFSLVMDSYNPHFSTRPLPPSSPSASSGTPLGGGYNNEISTTPLTDTAPPGSSSVTQWGTPPSLSAYPDQPQSHYNYPQLQPRSTRSHTVPEVKYMVNDYSTQPRAGPMFPPLDLHTTQLQFPINYPPVTLHPVSPTHQSLPLLYPQGTPSELQFPLQQTQMQVTSPPWHDPSTPTAYSFPRVPQSQSRSYSYPEIPTPKPSSNPQDINRAAYLRQGEVVLPEQSLLAYKPDNVQHKQEEFNQDDVQVLKSLLSSGERVKWRYISSRLSSLSGRRATSSTCLKKSKELFKLPSEKSSGTLGTSLAYVVHNSWDKIKEDMI